MCGEQIQLAENSVPSGVLERWRAPGALALLCVLATACGGKVGDISGDGASDLATGGRTRNGPHDGASGDLAAGGTIAAGGTLAAGGTIAAGGALAAGGTIATGGPSQTGRIDVSESPIAPCEFIVGLENDTCTPTTVAVQRPPQNVLLVLDKSGTLADTSPYGRSKWEVLTAALNEALNEDDLSGGDELSLGLMLFPAQEVTTACMLDACCVMPEYPIDVEIGPARETVPVILDVLDATYPSGLTPTAAALELAQMYFESGTGSMLEGENYVLLVSDGGPNCNSSLACSDDACTLTNDATAAQLEHRIRERLADTEDHGRLLWRGPEGRGSNRHHRGVPHALVSLRPPKHLATAGRRHPGRLCLRLSGAPPHRRYRHPVL